MPSCYAAFPFRPEICDAVPGRGVAEVGSGFSGIGYWMLGIECMDDVFHEETWESIVLG